MKPRKREKKKRETKEENKQTNKQKTNREPKKAAGRDCILTNIEQNKHLERKRKKEKRK
jgi:hypothetical protein